MTLYRSRGQLQVRAAVADDQVRARILQRAAVLVGEERRGLHHLRRDLEHVSPLDRVGERRAGGDAAAETDNGDSPRRSWTSNGRCAMSFWVSMSPRFEASIFRQPRASWYRRDASPTPSPSALAVVKQSAGLELGCEIEIARHERRVHVGPAREQLAIPWGAKDEEEHCGRRRGQAGDTVRPARLTASNRSRVQRRPARRSPPEVCPEVPAAG